MSYVIMPELHSFPATCHEPGKFLAEELFNCAATRAHNAWQRRPCLHACPEVPNDLPKRWVPGGNPQTGQHLSTPGKTGATKVPMKDSALTKGDGCDGWYGESQASDLTPWSCHPLLQMACAWLQTSAATCGTMQLPFANSKSKTSEAAMVRDAPAAIRSCSVQSQQPNVWLQPSQVEGSKGGHTNHSHLSGEASPRISRITYYTNHTHTYIYIYRYSY